MPDQPEEKNNVYKDADKKIIAAYIKSFVKENGYISTKFGVKNGLNGIQKKWDDGDKGNHEWAFVKSVSALVAADGEFIREINHEDKRDFDILLNPDFRLNKALKRNANLSLVFSFVATTFIVLSFFKDDHKHKQRKNQAEQTEVQSKLKQNIDTIPSQVIQIPSIRKSKSDSVKK